MDNYADRFRPPFGPDRRLTAAGRPGRGLCRWSPLSLRTPAAAILAVGALVLLGYAVTDLVFWPRLVATARG